MFPTLYLIIGVIVAGTSVSTTADSNAPPSLYNCIDWECEEWISQGRTMLRYIGKTDKHLSFQKNQEIYIISKPMDTNQPDWVGKIGKKVGLVPRDMVREDRMNKNPTKFKLDLQEILGLVGQDTDAGQEEVESEDDPDDEADVDVDDNDEDQSSNEVDGIEIEDIELDGTPPDPGAADAEKAKVDEKEQKSVPEGTPVVPVPPETTAALPLSTVDALPTTTSALVDESTTNGQGIDSEQKSESSTIDSTLLTATSTVLDGYEDPQQHVEIVSVHSSQSIPPPPVTTTEPTASTATFEQNISSEGIPAEEVHNISNQSQEAETHKEVTDEGAFLSSAFSDSGASSSINLQPSTDTVLQGSSTILDEYYLTETPKTIAAVVDQKQEPSVTTVEDEITPRIPETVLLNSMTSIIENQISSSSPEREGEQIIATRVEKSESVVSSTGEEEETQFVLSQIEEKTSEPQLSESSATTGAQQETIQSLSNEEVPDDDEQIVFPEKVETLQPHKLNVVEGEAEVVEPSDLESRDDNENTTVTVTDKSESLDSGTASEIPTSNGEPEVQKDQLDPVVEPPTNDNITVEPQAPVEEKEQPLEEVSLEVVVPAEEIVDDEEEDNLDVESTTAAPIATLENGKEDSIETEASLVLTNITEEMDAAIQTEQQTDAPSGTIEAEKEQGQPPLDSLISINNTKPLGEEAAIIEEEKEEPVPSSSPAPEPAVSQELKQEPQELLTKEAETQTTDSGGSETVVLTVTPEVYHEEKEKQNESGLDVDIPVSIELDSALPDVTNNDQEGQQKADLSPVAEPIETVASTVIDTGDENNNDLLQPEIPASPESIVPGPTEEVPEIGQFFDETVQMLAGRSDPKANSNSPSTTTETKTSPSVEETHQPEVVSAIPPPPFLPASSEHSHVESEEKPAKAVAQTEQDNISISEEEQPASDPLLAVPVEASPVNEESVPVEANEKAQQPEVQEHKEHTDDETTDDHHRHDHGHRHHHRHRHFSKSSWNESSPSSSIIVVIKHLSSTLLSFLPEPLQDTILDVDDALVFTGIIALTLVSICVPYFFIEGYMSVRPLKKKVVELNKSLWKVNAAYETQQEEFEIFKRKAIAHDEFRRRAEQSENDVVILKTLEQKHREQIQTLKTQLKSQLKEAKDIRALAEKALQDKKTLDEESANYKAAAEKASQELTKAREELNNFQTHAKSTALQLGMSSKNVEMMNTKITMLEEETEHLKSQLTGESEKRKTLAAEITEAKNSKAQLENELADVKKICVQYESTVDGLNNEIYKLESELTTIKETLGEDSPLIELAEIQAKAEFCEKEADSLRTRLDCVCADNENLRGKLEETIALLDDTRNERDTVNRKLTVLETYWSEREEEQLKTIESLQQKFNLRDKGRDELIEMLEQKDNELQTRNETFESLKEEMEEQKAKHRNEIRALEAKGHENWLSLCQAERKAQDARKDAEMLRQRLTAMVKEKERNEAQEDGDDDDSDGLSGQFPMVFPAVIPHELVPPPILDMDDEEEPPPSYFGLGDFVPPPPLPLDDDDEGDRMEPRRRPPPLGGTRVSPSFSDMTDDDDDDEEDEHNNNILMSPIRRREEEECTDGSSGSGSGSPPVRGGGWVSLPSHRGGGGGNLRRVPTSSSRSTSSPIQPGANL